MRNVLATLLGTVVLSAGAAAPAVGQSAPKLAYINTQRILVELPAAQQAQQTLERELQGYQEELRKLEDEIKKMMADFDQQQRVLSEDARQSQLQAIQQKQIEYRQRAMELEQQAGKRQQELMQPVMTRIQSAIEEIRAQGNYAMIFDAAAGAIIAADTTLDVTDQVLTRLKTAGSTP